MGGSGLGKETNHGNYFSSEISEKKIILTAELSRAVVLKLITSVALSSSDQLDPH